MFPIYDLNGNPVAFSGRIYNTRDTAKYVNTKENEQVAFITLDSQPDYELELVDNSTKTNEKEALETIKENSVTTAAKCA